MKENDKDITPNNNPTDFDRLARFQALQLSRFKKKQQNFNKDRALINAQEWSSNLPWPWNHADLSYFTGDIVNSAHDIVRLNQGSIVFTYGAKHRGKTFYTYAIIKELIKSGYVTPSGVKKISFAEGVNNIRGTWESRQWKNNVFNHNTKVLFIEGLSLDSLDLMSEDVQRFWTEAISLIENNGCILFITIGTSESNLSFKIIADRLRIPYAAVKVVSDRTYFPEVKEINRNGKKLPSI